MAERAKVDELFRPTIRKRPVVCVCSPPADHLLMAFIHTNHIALDYLEDLSHLDENTSKLCL